VGFEAASEAQPLPAEMADMLRSNNEAAAARAIGYLGQNTSQEARFGVLDGAALAFALTGDFAKAEAMARESLALSPGFVASWNYGNAIHNSNVALGLVALNEGSIENAKQHLLYAGRSSGSPQLNSFGPNMGLALELSRFKEWDTVLEYFALCRVFWKSGQVWLDIWEDMVRGGCVPNCAFHRTAAVP
jgi:hypothetical protein